MATGIRSPTPGHGILVAAIDDNPSALDVIRSVTDQDGHTLLTAMDGASGVELVGSWRPDIVLCDVMMPGMDGYEVCRRLRSDTDTWHIPIVLITALDAREDRLRGLEAGCDDFLTKPIDRLVLRARIRSLVRIKRLTGLLQDALGRYATREIVQNVLTNPRAADLGGQRQVVTTLFMDICDFTSFSELNPVELVVGMLNECFTAMERVVSDHGGVLDKFIGDALMARFTARGLRGTQQAALKAIQAAVAMRQAMRSLSAAWSEQGRPALDNRISIATGTCIVGNIGSTRHMQYTAIGDSVNTASRLQAVAKSSGAGIVATADTWELARPGLPHRPLGPVRIAGKSSPVEVYAVREPEPLDSTRVSPETRSS